MLKLHISQWNICGLHNIDNISCSLHLLKYHSLVLWYWHKPILWGLLAVRSFLQLNPVDPVCSRAAYLTVQLWEVHNVATTKLWCVHLVCKHTVHLQPTFQLIMLLRCFDGFLENYLSDEQLRNCWDTLHVTWWLINSLFVCVF